MREQKGRSAPTEVDVGYGNAVGGGGNRHPAKVAGSHCKRFRPGVLG
jgi:hypothetical protein